MISNLLAQNAFFKGLDPAELDLFIEIAEEKTFANDEMIFKEGSKGDKMYLIISGTIEIWKSEDTQARGSRLARLREGEIFGEMALFDQGPRSATAVASLNKETKLIIWQDEKIAKLINVHPETGNKILNNILRKLSHRLRIANDAIHTLLRANQYVAI